MTRAWNVLRSLTRHPEFQLLVAGHLVELTIPAPVSRTLPGEGSRGDSHAALPDLNFLASRRRTATNLFARTYPAYLSHSSGVRVSSEITLPFGFNSPVSPQLQYGRTEFQWL
jgi:hypothetical protein